MRQGERIKRSPKLFDDGKLINIFITVNVVTIYIFSVYNKIILEDRTKCYLNVFNNKRYSLLFSSRQFSHGNCEFMEKIARIYRKHAFE